MHDNKVHTKFTGRVVWDSIDLIIAFGNGECNNRDPNLVVYSLVLIDRSFGNIPIGPIPYGTLKQEIQRLVVRFYPDTIMCQVRM